MIILSMDGYPNISLSINMAFCLFIPFLILIYGNDAVALKFDSKFIAKNNEMIVIRRKEIISKEISKPFPSIDCDANQDSVCITSLLNYGLALLSHNKTGSDDIRANEVIGNAISGLKKNRSPGEFYFNKSSLLYLIFRLFGPNGSARAAVLTSSIGDSILDLFFEYSKSNCSISLARNLEVWRIWRSENHSAQRDGTCWAAADLLSSSNNNVALRYNDGSTVREQLQGWTNFLILYLKERGKNGGLIEYFSPTYTKYSLNFIYIFHDFSSDQKLKQVSKSFLSLWWSIWAQEQINGVHGGCKTRSYVKNIKLSTSPMSVIAYIYFGLNAKAHNYSPAEASAVLSRYTPPALVSEIVADLNNQRVYDAITLVPGLQQQEFKDEWYTLAPDKPKIMRITSVGPGYAMGLAMIPKLLRQSWASISSQNRWSGVAFSQRGASQVVIQPISDNENTNQYNAIWGVQRQGVQIVQRLDKPYSLHAGPMAIMIGKDLIVEELNGWLFINSSAFLAFRPAYGGYDVQRSDGLVVKLKNSNSPVIMQVVPKNSYSSFESFKLAILEADLVVADDFVSFHGVGHEFKLDFKMAIAESVSRSLNEILMEKHKIIDGPYVKQEDGSAIVQIFRSGRTESFSFE